MMFINLINERINTIKLIIREEGIKECTRIVLLYFYKKVVFLFKLLISREFFEISDVNYRLIYSELRRKNKKLFSNVPINDMEIEIRILVYLSVYNKGFLEYSIASIRESSIKCNFTIICEYDLADILDFSERQIEVFKSYDDYFNYIDKGGGIRKKEYIIFIKSGDIIEDYTLSSFLDILKSRSSDIVYSDDDVHSNLKDFREPRFKPDFSPNYLKSYPYIGHIICCNSVLFEGFLKSGIEYEDINLPYYLSLYASVEQLSFFHIQDVLFHIHIKNTSPIIYSSILKSVLSFYFSDVKISDGIINGTYKVSNSFDSTEMVSVVIPFRDKVELLKDCIESIIRHSKGRNYEIILVSNNSSEDETFYYLQSLRCNNFIKVFELNEEFNYSKLNNFGVSKANGDVLVFLNNDTIVITDNWIEEILAQLSFPEVGVVGAKLLYPNERIQHAGVVLGFGGCADHLYLNSIETNPGYLNRLNCLNNYSAVTGACLSIKRTVFNNVGGFNEKDLKVAFNDVDLCLRVGGIGLYIVYNPYIRIVHYESISRGKELVGKDLDRFRNEIDYIKRKWKTNTVGDPFYNRNLTLNNKNSGLKTFR